MPIRDRLRGSAGESLSSTPDEPVGRLSRALQPVSELSFEGTQDRQDPRQIVAPQMPLRTLHAGEERGGAPAMDDIDTKLAADRLGHLANRVRMASVRLRALASPGRPPLFPVTGAAARDGGCASSA